MQAKNNLMPHLDAICESIHKKHADALNITDVYVAEKVDIINQAIDELEIKKLEESIPEINTLSEKHNKHCEKLLDLSEENILSGLAQIEKLTSTPSVTLENSSKVYKTKYFNIFSYTKWVAAAMLLLALGVFTSNYLLQTNTVEFIAKRSEVKKHTLQDGSHIVLNSESRLNILSKFEDSPQRLVHLEGEGFFEVTRDVEKPFVIQTDAITFKVLGTSFNIKSYPNEENIYLEVSSGSVGFQLNDESGKSGIIKKGEHIIYNKVTKSLKNISNLRYNIGQWKEGKLSFNGHSLQEILNAIARKFDIQIVLKAKEYKNRTMVAEFGGANLAECLDFCVRVFNDLSYEIKENKKVVIIDKKKDNLPKSK